MTIDKIRSLHITPMLHLIFFKISATCDANVFNSIFSLN